MKQETCLSTSFSKSITQLSISLALLIFICAPTNAQDRSRKIDDKKGEVKITGFEISGGGRLATAEGSTSRISNIIRTDEERRIGGNVFSKLHIELGSKWIKLNPEIFFIQNGTQQVYSNVNMLGQSALEQKIRLNYAGISIPFSLFVPFKKDVKLSGLELYGGGFADYLISGYYKESNGKEQAIDFGEEEQNKIDWGLSAGLGLLFNGFVIRAGYDKGLKNISFITATSTGAAFQNNIKNSGMYCVIGYTKEI